MGLSRGVDWAGGLVSVRAMASDTLSDADVGTAGHGDEVDGMVGSGRVRDDLTAALIVIGNEILSGKVTDTNTPFLAREMRTLGVALERVVVIPDNLEQI